MDFTNDSFIEMYYEKYVMICDQYADGITDYEEAVSELRTLHEAIGIYVSGLFELKRRKEGG